jgi:Putative transposase
VTVQGKDYARGNQWRTMTLPAMEFLRRFVQHVLPRGVVRIRQSGDLASVCRTARLALARRLLRRPSRLSETSSVTSAWHCPRCGASMVIGPILSALQLATRTLGFDTS